MSIPERWSNVPDWQRMVARDLNPLVQGYPYLQLDSEPSGTEEGFTYYDTGLKKVRTWDGSAWRNHF